MASARKRNPQTFNRYSYVTNNPLNLIDPLGLSGCDPKTDPNCAEQGPNGTPVQLQNGGTPGVIASVTIVASQAAEVIATTATQISTQIIPRALERLPSMSSILTGAGRLASVPGIIVTALPPSGSACQIETGDDFCGRRTSPQIENQPDTTTGTTVLPISTPTPPETIPLWRGVPFGHEGYPDATQGIARPRGGNATPLQHNLGDTRSIFTSWTTDPFYAQDRAGSGGIVLFKNIPLNQTVPSPGRHDDIRPEFEVLVRGTVTGASVIRVP